MKLFHLRRTKIVATIGPACADKKTLLSMVDAGLDVARLNFSHADHETHKKSLEMVSERKMPKMASEVSESRQRREC